MPGYKDWIDTIDIRIDYYSAFMKAWIAFNAWYCSGPVKTTILGPAKTTNFSPTKTTNPRKKRSQPSLGM